VFVLGDNAYFSGSAREYRDCYDPTWGSERGRTRPVPGNHEYDGASAGIPTSRTSARKLARPVSATTATTWGRGTSSR
jgi:hypothetical protein